MTSKGMKKAIFIKSEADVSNIDKKKKSDSNDSDSDIDEDLDPKELKLLLNHLKLFNLKQENKNL